MKRMLPFLCLAVLAYSSCGSSVPRLDMLRKSTLDEGQRADLAKIERIYGRSRFHLESIEKVASLLAVSRYNRKTLVYIAELMSTVGFHTEILTSVASAASAASMEIPEFKDLADLAVTRGSRDVGELAAWAAGLDGVDRLAELRERIERMRASTEWKTVAEAVERVDQMQREIDKALKR